MSRPTCVLLRGLIPCVLLAVCGVLRAAEPEGANLVRQLGDDSYQVRQQAVQQLSDLGLKAQDALMAGLKDSDPQVRRQCRWILSDVLEGEFQQRVQAFLADTEDKQPHRIPGWERYREVIGKDADARKLFVEMLKAERALLESTAAGPAAAGEGLALRMRQLMQMMQSPDPKIRKIPSLGTTAALLFVISDPKVELPNQNEDAYLQNFVQQGEFQKALTDGPFKPGVRKLVGQWILRPGSDNNLYIKFHLTVQYDIKEGLDPAIRILRDRQVNRTHFRIQAMGIVAKMGGKEYAGLLDSLLDDKSEVFRGQIAQNKQVTVQIRDVALGWLIHLTEQDHAQYGMDGAKNDFEQVKKNPKHYQPNFVQMGFPDDAKRDEALKKWKAYVADHALPKLPTLPPPADPPKPVVAQPAPRVARAAVGNAGGKDPGDQDRPFRGITLELADRALVQALNNARYMCERGEYAAAMPLLDKILASKSDFAFQPDVEVPLLRCLKPEAEGILAGLPPKGLAVYKSLYEANARHDLAEAVKAGDIKAVTAVGQRFFFTTAGTEATYLLAAHHRDRGQFFQAALYFERVRNRSPYADRLEPALSLALATCWSRTGMNSAADAALRALKARDPLAKVPVAGQPRALFAKADEALHWLETIAGPLKAAAAEGWLMFRGDPTRNVAAAVGNPFLRAKSLLPMSADNEVTQTVGELRTQQAEQYRAALPSLHPLVVGDTVLLRTASQLAAVHLPGGELLWQAGLEDSLRQRLQIKAKAATTLRSDSFSQALRRRFWDDLTFGTLSSDGQYVFGVEDVPFGSWADEQCMVVGPDGQRRLDNDAVRKHNLLTAHDVRTGKLAWEIGGLPGADAGPLGGALFLGPPLPLGGRLYAIVDVSGETRLIEIDAKTGSLVNELTLALREGSPDDANGRVFFGGVQPNNGRLESVASSSPSYADGVLVCRAAENQYIAVNLATRSVLWVYQMPEAEMSGMGMMFGIMRQKQLLEALDPNPADSWADGSVTIAAGRVLLTPPDANELYCLDLNDGRLLWSSPRRDGLYVGGVAGGRVLVVGRGGLWALDLEDGTPAWKPQRLLLPAGALPSGRGLVSQDRYLLPLSTGEVAAIDLKKGRLMSRSRSPEHIVPGNLIAYHDAVLAQSVDGLWRFDSLATRDGQLAAALREHPDDPDLLAERGAVLLGNGQIAEAVGLLRKAMEKKPSPQTRQWLADALLDGLRADFETFAPQAEQLDTLVEQSDGRQQYLRELAAGLQDAGRPKAAFDAYLKLIDATDKPAELTRYETARLVRRDRWLAARIEEVRAAAAPADREEIDRRIAARLKDDKLPEFVAYFGAHPAAHEARLRLAQQAIAKQEWTAAEQWLRAVVRGGDAAQQNAAIARLAALLRETKQADDAARCYDILRGRLAQTACLDGKTGSELFAALPADDPVRRTLDKPAKWPLGKVLVEAPDKPNINGNNSQRVPLAVYWQEDPLGTPFSVEVDMNQRRIAASDDLGRRRWEVSMAEKDQQWQFVHYPDASSQIWPLGHLQVAWIGNRVAAIDTLGEKAKILWTQEPFKLHPQFGWIGFPLRMRMRMMGQQMQPTALPASEPLPLVVTPQAVCLLQNRTLRAFDPVTGLELWNRDDLVADSSLFGDDELLIVTPPDAAEAVVYSMLDGHELGRCSVPPLAERMWTTGRRVLTWKIVQEKVRMALVDPWAGQTLWQRTFDSKAQPWLIDGNEVAVLEPEGLFTVLSIVSGEPVTQAQVDAMPRLEGIWAQRSAERYVLIARDPSVGANAQTMMMQPFNGSYSVTGRVYGLDRRTGKLTWSTIVDKQGIRMGQPAELPVLTFFIQGNVLEGNQYRGYSAVLCLDKRNGRVLYGKESNNQNGQFFETQVDLEKSVIDLRTPLGPVKMTFTDEAEETKPAKK